MNIYIPGRDGRVAQIERELHIVDDLRAKVLIGVDIQGPERIILDLGHRTATIRSCKGIQVVLSLVPRTNQRIRRAVLTQNDTTIAPRSIRNVPVLK